MLWTVYPFSLQFRSSVLEKEYCAKVQQGVQNHTRRAGIFVIVTISLVALLHSRIYAGSIGSAFLLILQTPVFLILIVALIVAYDQQDE